MGSFVNRRDNATTVFRTILLGLCVATIALAFGLGNGAPLHRSALVAAQVSPPVSPLPAAEPAADVSPALSFRLPIFGDPDNPVGLWRIALVMTVIVAVVGLAIWRERE